MPVFGREAAGTGWRVAAQRPARSGRGAVRLGSGDAARCPVKIMFLVGPALNLFLHWLERSDQRRRERDMPDLRKHGGCVTESGKALRRHLGVGRAPKALVSGYPERFGVRKTISDIDSDNKKTENIFNKAIFFLKKNGLPKKRAIKK